MATLLVVAGYYTNKCWEGRSNQSGWHYELCDPRCQTGNPHSCINPAWTCPHVGNMKRPWFSTRGNISQTLLSVYKIYAQYHARWLLDKYTQILTSGFDIMHDNPLINGWQRAWNLNKGYRYPKQIFKTEVSTFDFGVANSVVLGCPLILSPMSKSKTQTSNIFFDLEIAIMISSQFEVGTYLIYPK